MAEKRAQSVGVLRRRGIQRLTGTAQMDVAHDERERRQRGKWLLRRADDCT